MTPTYNIRLSSGRQRGAYRTSLIPLVCVATGALLLSNCTKSNQEFEDTDLGGPALSTPQSAALTEPSGLETASPTAVPVETDIGGETAGAFGTAKKPQPILTAFVGDVMFGRYDETGLVPNLTAYSSAFKWVKSFLVADLSVVNLETPLLWKPFSKCPWPPKLRFVAPPEAADGLVDAGFHVANLANNHVFDMRNKGVVETQEILRDKGLVVLGAPVQKGENPFIVSTVVVKGQKLALIPITTARNSLDGPTVPALPYTPKDEEVPGVLAPLIAKARASHDRVIVFAHWGPADEPTPRKARRDAARALIDLGADAVIGQGAHVLQGVEMYKQGIIAHSLGDFLFDVVWDERRLTGVLKLTFDPERKCPARVAFHPVVTVQTLEGIYPKPAKGILRKAVVQRLVALSKAMGTTWEEGEGGALVMKLPETCE